MERLASASEGQAKSRTRDPLVRLVLMFFLDQPIENIGRHEEYISKACKVLRRSLEPKRKF